MMKSSTLFEHGPLPPTSTSRPPDVIHVIGFPRDCPRPSPEEVGHAYGPARNSVSRMVSKHCEINVETALEVRFCTCPVARTRSCRSTILGAWIVEMEPYCSYVSVALECHNFAARAS